MTCNALNGGSPTIGGLVDTCRRLVCLSTIGNGTKAVRFPSPEQEDHEDPLFRPFAKGLNRSLSTDCQELPDQCRDRLLKAVRFVLSIRY